TDSHGDLCRDLASGPRSRRNDRAGTLDRRTRARRPVPERAVVLLCGAHRGSARFDRRGPKKGSVIFPESCSGRVCVSEAAATPARGKRILLFASKLGYQTRTFGQAARQLNMDLIFVTDRCHQLDDPWGDRAMPVHFESPERAAYEVLQSLRDASAAGMGAPDGILALGDRPAVAAAYVARGLALAYN